MAVFGQILHQMSLLVFSTRFMLFVTWPQKLTSTNWQ